MQGSASCQGCDTVSLASECVCGEAGVWGEGAKVNEFHSHWATLVMSSE
jgi:hypothetical protein